MQIWVKLNTRSRHFYGTYRTLNVYRSRVVKFVKFITIQSIDPIDIGLYFFKILNRKNTSAAFIKKIGGHRRTIERAISD